MEFNTWNSDPFKTLPHKVACPSKPDMSIYIDFLALLLNTLMIIAVLRRMVDFCKDPVNENLSKKVEDLELENETLRNQLDDLASKMEHLNESLKTSLNIISETNSGASEDEEMPEEQDTQS